MQKLRFAVGLLLFVILLTACGESSEDIAKTMVAQTQESAAAMDTSTPEASETPSPTIPPTETSTPTEIPTLTPTPGPIVLSDDFSSRSEIWGDCTVCNWLNDSLYLGPYQPNSTLAPYYIICEACGTPLFFRMAVDAKWIEGQADRGFGLLTRYNNDNIDTLEITSLQFWGYFSYNRHQKSWDAYAFDFTGLLKPSTQVNRIEFLVEPVNNNTANIFIRINEKNAQIYYNQPVKRNQVGLVVGFHSIGVSFDNFEFEEIEP